MKRTPRVAISRLARFCCVIGLAFGSRHVSLADEIRFDRDILPLLSDNCFGCHGPDEQSREADLRLDEPAGAFAKLGSGEHAIVAGSSGTSELYRRITAEDEDVLMPPVDSGKRLSPQARELIKTWIDSGAPWAKHWAFEPPVMPRVPAPVVGWTASNPVDRFIQAALQTQGLRPEAEANKETLIRRATLDLTGLPPTVQEVDDFLADPSPNAYERVVDRLLESSKYGEHMGRIWLDSARYADTHGLHLDNERSIWPYREWVISALNQNMPFDQFTVEQLAGDLLPNPTLSQRVATGFNRCNVTTSEGGSIDDEYYVRYAVDRVETTSTVWLGLTAGCAVCHDHKFDPLTQREFYSLFSYFFNLTEKAMDGNALLPPPAVKVPNAEQAARQSGLESDLANTKQQIETMLGALEYVDPSGDQQLGPLSENDETWFEDALPAGAEAGGDELPSEVPAGDGGSAWRFITQSEGPVFSGEKGTVRTASGLSQHFFTKAEPALELGPHDKLFAYVYLDPANPPQTVQLQFNDGSWEHRAFWGEDKGHAAGRNNASNLRMGDLPATGQWVRLEVTAGAVGLAAGAKLNGWSFSQFGGTVYWDHPGVTRVAPLARDQLASIALWSQFRQRVKHPSLPDNLQKVLDIAAAERSEEQTAQLRRYYLQTVHPDTSPQFTAPMQKVASLEQQLSELDALIPATLVMQDRDEPRQAYLLERGQYTEKRDPVSSAVPAWIAPALPDASPNRLGLAQWLIQPSHPLTSRVTVNRFWQHFFGTGLVKTSEDFGIQGARPSHPELLDWMSTHFMQSGWNVKAFQKMLVMSMTYRQSSHVAAEKLAQDPENRWLARGPRFRLDAEVIRDQALAMSGLLVETMGGKSVRPYQPPGLWEPVGFGGSNTAIFTQDQGDKLYRRSMYTFWKRTSPPPTMSTFDAPDRETCQVRRARTNTPLQALALMNDVQFVEAARKFAERVLHQKSCSVPERIEFAFRSATSRRPNEKELSHLTRLLDELLAEFRADPESAQKLISAGESPRDASLDPAELSAWTMITHLLLNLNETITKG